MEKNYKVKRDWTATLSVAFLLSIAGSSAICFLVVVVGNVIYALTH